MTASTVAVCACDWESYSHSLVVALKKGSMGKKETDVIPWSLGDVAKVEDIRLFA